MASPDLGLVERDLDRAPRVVVRAVADSAREQNRAFSHDFRLCRHPVIGPTSGWSV
jgi:hypothetical protein